MPMAPFTFLAVVYGLVLLATPVLTIALYVRYARLRKQLNEFTEENAKNLTKLQRAVGELQSKLAATGVHTTPAVEKPATSEARQTTNVPVPRSYPHVQIPPTVAVPPPVEVQPPPKPQTPPSVLITEKKPEPAPEVKPQLPAPAVPVPPVIVTPPITPATPPPQKPPTPTAPLEAKPVEHKPPLVPTPLVPLEARPTPPL